LELLVQPGESYILKSRRVSVEELKGIQQREPRTAHGLVIGSLGVNALNSAPVSVGGRWQVEFFAGGPALPKPVSKTELTSWTTWRHDPAFKAFSGTARYKIAFPLPERGASGWVLDLGTVHNSAHVQLNGRSLGTLIAPPYRVAIPPGLLRARNELEVEVTNLMANRIADMDRRKAPWQKFFFVNIGYKAFDAASWEPLPSGLLGPVRLIPFKAK
jgi:hypothetical protein